MARAMKTLFRITLIGTTLGWTACFAQPAAAPDPAADLLADATQLVVVTTPGWDATSGELRRYSRDAVAGAWQLAGPPTPIVLGRTGLAWGVGFERLAVGATAGPHKHEGDGKSPAGIFPIGTAFGFPPADSMAWLRLPYLPLTAATECVDDTASSYYNSVVARTAVPSVDWHSSERMRTIGQYRLGAVVAYNRPPVKAGGSCIFLHIWGGPASTTSGCTALEQNELARLLEWLDPRARSVMVQLPVTIYQRLQAAWRLPPVASQRP